MYSNGNVQAREPALCQLYRHTMEFAAVSNSRRNKCNYGSCKIHICVAY